jgi:hypothetical protein
LLRELRSSSIRLLSGLRQPALRQWDFWGSAHSVDIKPSAYFVNKSVLDKQSLVQGSNAEDLDTKELDKVSYSFDVV